MMFPSNIPPYSLFALPFMKSILNAILNISFNASMTVVLSVHLVLAHSGKMPSSFWRENCRVQSEWLIQNFPGGANSGGWCANLLFCKCFAENCMNWKNLDPRGGAHVPGVPWIRHLIYYPLIIVHPTRIQELTDNCIGYQLCWCHRRPFFSWPCYGRKDSEKFVVAGLCIAGMVHIIRQV